MKIADLLPLARTMSIGFDYGHATHDTLIADIEVGLRAHRALQAEARYGPLLTFRHWWASDDTSGDLTQKP